MRRMQRLLGTIVSLWTFHACSAFAFAQAKGRVPDEDGGIIQWVLAAGLIVVICGPALIPTKRSHLN